MGTALQTKGHEKDFNLSFLRLATLQAKVESRRYRSSRKNYTGALLTSIFSDYYYICAVQPLLGEWLT